MADCKACGHRDTQHAKFGCNQGFCKCELSSQEVIDFEKLAALREAGEKIAELLGEDITDDQLTEALEAWKSANK